MNQKLYCRRCNVPAEITSSSGVQTRPDKVTCPSCKRSGDYKKIVVESGRHIARETVKKALKSRTMSNPKPDFIIK